MAGIRLESENVRYVLQELLTECDLYGREGKEAEKMVHYICGLNDMANAIIKAIKDLGGK